MRKMKNGQQQAVMLTISTSAIIIAKMLKYFFFIFQVPLYQNVYFDLYQFISIYIVLYLDLFFNAYLYVYIKFPSTLRRQIPPVKSCYPEPFFS